MPASIYTFRNHMDFLSFLRVAVIFFSFTQPHTCVGLPSTCCLWRQQKQLGFLWSDMIVKWLIKLSSSASIQLSQSLGDKMSHPVHQSCKLFRGAVGCKASYPLLSGNIGLFISCRMFPSLNSISHLRALSHFISYAEFMRYSLLPRRANPRF